jgi:hypothetical protein
MNQAKRLVDQLVEGLKRVDPNLRLQLLLGGLVATADELRVGEAQLVALVNTAIQQRAKVLEMLRQGVPVLVGPDGAPVLRVEPPVSDVCPLCKRPWVKATGNAGAGAGELWCPYCAVGPKAAQAGDTEHLDPGPACCECGCPANVAPHHYADCRFRRGANRV